MAIDAVFLHDQGYRFNQVYEKKHVFLRSIDKQKNCTFVEAVDYALAYVVRPSNLPEYRRIKA